MNHEMNHSAIWLTHVLFVGPLFVYMGIKKGDVPRTIIYDITCFRM